MEYIIRIEDKKDSFTQTDKNIARYILENKDLIINQSSIDLAKNTNSSQAAVTRFVKKIGYNSFVDMKISIAKSFEEESNFIEDEIKKTDKIGDIISKSKANIQKTVEKTYALINDEKIERACQFLNKTNKIYLSGVAGSRLICEDFYYKLLRAGADVYYEKDAHTNLSRISHIGKNDLLIAITYGAKTKEVIESFNYAKIKGSSIICISKNENSKIAKESDVFIKIPSSEKEIRYGAIASRFSSLIITDILYFSYIGQNYDYVVENLKVSKKFTDKLKN